MSQGTGCCKDHFIKIIGVDGETRRIPFAEDPDTGDLCATVDTRVLFGQIGPTQITATNQPTAGATLTAIASGPNGELQFVWVPA